MTTKRWIAKEIPDAIIVGQLEKDLKVSHMIATLIAQRGISTYEEARIYFSPKKKDLFDPFLMKDMEKAVHRIHEAIVKNEKILVYGDYDVDGTTSVAIVFRFFSSIYQNLLFYVPDRFHEGYGISMEGIDYAIEQDVNLIIALDCGIKEVEKVKYAASHHIDVIICDHHTPGAELPEAWAILNPKQIACTYPYNELSGCGIGFKLIQAYTEAYKIQFDPFTLIDFVAVSIASDIVPMTGENRTLCFLGLEKINHDPSIPFMAMKEQLSIEKELSVTDLVFIIGPRLNASGRITHARTTVEFLLATTFEGAISQMALIDHNNVERKDIDHQTLLEALQIIENDEILREKKSTVLYDPSWHKGVIGIVASRVIEHYYKPTILLTESEGYLTGSARSIRDFNLYQALEKCSDLLEKFGGHQYAAGLSLKQDKFDAFCAKFESIVSESVTEEMMIPVLDYDLELDPDLITFSFIRTLLRFGPFGPGNMKPRFVTRNVKVSGEVRIVGNKHLKFNIQAGKNKQLGAIGFDLSFYAEHIDKGQLFDICYVVEENQWNNNVYIQLNIKDIHLH